MDKKNEASNEAQEPATEGSIRKVPICTSLLASSNTHRQSRRRRSPRNRRLFLTAIDGKEGNPEIAGSYWMCSRFTLP